MRFKRERLDVRSSSNTLDELAPQAVLEHDEATPRAETSASGKRKVQQFARKEDVPLKQGFTTHVFWYVFTLSLGQDGTVRLWFLHINRAIETGRPLKVNIHSQAAMSNGTFALSGA